MSPTSCRCSTPRRHITLAENGHLVKARRRPAVPASLSSAGAPVLTGLPVGSRSGDHVPDARHVRRVPAARPRVPARRSLAELEANPIRFLTRELEGRLDEARTAVAAFLNADPGGLVPVPNATTGVATVLGSIRLRPGDELLTNDHEYNATLNALETVAERAKARVVRVSIPLPIRHPEQVVEALLAGVTPRTRLALVSHVTSPSGIVFPIESIVRELDRLGVDTLVDAAHAPGMVPIDLGALGAAYWTGNGHKWLCAPKGSGVLHVREDRRARRAAARDQPWPQRPPAGPAGALEGVRLAGHRQPDVVPGAARGDPRRRRAVTRGLAGAHGREPVARTPGPGSSPGRDGRRPDRAGIDGRIDGRGGPVGRCVARRGRRGRA